MKIHQSIPVWAAALTCSVALAQSDKVIKIVVPFPAGAAVDITARKIAPVVSKYLGQPVIVDNRPGAGGNLAAQQVLRAAPDGLTFMYTAPATLVLNKYLYPRLGFDHTAFEPVSLAVSYPFFLFTNAAAPAQTLKDLDGAVRKKPGGVSFGSYGVGTAPHLLIASLNSYAKVDYLHVPFLGGAPAVTGVLGGQIDVTVGGWGAIAEYVKAGRVTPLAVIADKRDPLRPQIPTLKEVYPSVPNITNWFAFLAPPKTPQATIERFSSAVQRALKDEQLRADLASRFIDPVGSTPAELAAYMDEQAKSWGEVVVKNHISAE